MALREFRDAGGTDWRVWNVSPTVSEGINRRRIDRRSPDPVLLYRGEEQRSGVDRRNGSGAGRFIPLREWLTFECELEKRRMVPIPKKWEELCDRDLEILCARAVTVPKLTHL